MKGLFESIQIQTMDKSNLKCSFCPNSYLPLTGKLMKKKLYYKIIDELADLKYEGRVSPHLMNESLKGTQVGEEVIAIIYYEKCGSWRSRKF